jgi:xylan 1,4-beta-xylosidase
VTRPVLAGFHPDPSVCRAGVDYYLVNSSFEYAPGVPIFSSRNLRDWQQIGNVLDRPSQLDVSSARPSGGIFAPTLRYHDGRFWMITTNMTDGGGQLLVTATDPAGPWSDPVRMPDVKGIDPDLAWSDEGTCHLTYASFDGITQVPIDPATGRLTGPTRKLWSGTGGKFPEGPHVFRRGQIWYLLIAEGGTERGHSVSIARGPSPTGPFEGFPGNPILTHRATAHPVQNTGHADLVECADGTWAMVYLGVRPRGTSPEFHVLGRETFAASVEWVHGWPRVIAPIEPTETAPVVVTDDFTGSELPSWWVSPGRFPADIARLGDDWLTIVAADPVPAAEAAVVGRRQEHLQCSVRATVDASQGVGGLTLRMDPAHHYDVEVTDGTVRAIAQIGPVRQVLAERAVSSGVAELTVSAVDPARGAWDPGGPDEVALGLMVDGEAVELATLDGRYVSTEVAGGMTGRIIGGYARSGSVRIGQFRYEGS